MADSTHPAPEGSVTETLQSLIVAFVLAMTFRGFVTEGFVIPTGSMAPTLMGQHFRLHSTQTGYEFAADARAMLEGGGGGTVMVRDPMLGPNFAYDFATLASMPGPRMGDRILVLKTLYPFADPHRFDVVVFKNPTNPTGDAQNYIKRLIGLPGETIWLADGDVFAGPFDAPHEYDDYKIQRKPEYVQRAVWQRIYDSDSIPLNLDKLAEMSPGRRWTSPWKGQGWQTDQRRSYRCDLAEPTLLRWDNDVIPLEDWVPYNMFMPTRRSEPRFPVSDLRVSSGVVADQAGLVLTLEIEARGQVFAFELGDGRAAMRIKDRGAETWSDEQVTDFAGFEPGRVRDVELWHVDQSMSIWVDGRRVGDPLYYDWTPPQRLEHAFPDMDFETWERASLDSEIQTKEKPSVRLTFSGSPLTLHRMRLDRDLYYRPDRHLNQPPGFGTHTSHLAILEPDQFFMCGDNSPKSEDSRLWGDPHPIVAAHGMTAPFIVERRLLLGKAWVVYFPAPYRLTEDTVGVIPDFGRLRFIR